MRSTVDNASSNMIFAVGVKTRDSPRDGMKKGPMKNRRTVPFYRYF